MRCGRRPCADLVLSALAAAAPGYQTSAFAILPQNVGKFVGAFDAYMASSAGKQIKGRVVLLAHVINVGYASMAEMEAYVDSLRDDPEWLKFMDTLGRSATHLGADVSRRVKAWGPASLKSLAP